MDFEKADFGPTSQQTSCVLCQAPIGGSYFTANGQVVCPSCKEGLAARPSGFEAGAFSRALLFGSLVAIAGSAVWYAVRVTTHYEFGLLAIGIGIVLGKAVQKGAGFRQGAIYPVLAVVLTYLSIVGANVPEILEHGEELSALAMVIVLLMAPFLGGVNNILGIIIIGIGLYEAWKYSRVPAFAFEGPFELKA